MRELPPAYPILNCKDIRVSRKTTVLFSRTLSQTLDLLNFCHSKSIVLSTKLEWHISSRGPSAVAELLDFWYYLLM